MGCEFLERLEALREQEVGLLVLAALDEFQVLLLVNKIEEGLVVLESLLCAELFYFVPIAIL